jgi:hypothetical protein
MLFRNQIKTVAIVALVIVFQSCHKDLDLFPTNDTTSETVFKTPAGYKQALAKIYVSMAVTGGDIPSEIVSDEGSTGFLRSYWYLQSLSTDEAGWTYSGNTDPIGIHQLQWGSTTQAVAGLYFRCFFTITLCNNYIKESTDGKLSDRGITGADAENIKKYRAEARFLRAYNYSVLMDLFGSVPFTDEAYAIGSGELPVQKSRADLFAYIETELKAIETELADPRANEYARVDKGAAWSLLARNYLNSKVYTGTEKNTEAITYANKVIGAGYTLHSNYKELMLADNHTLTNEHIWNIAYDGTKTQTYSGTTFLVHGPAGVTPDTTGTNGTWNCIRITEQFVNKFDAQDIRGQFWTSGQTKTMDVLLGDATKGYSSTKFRNKTRAGQIAPNIDAGKTFVDIDFPVFRLAEIYLIYAEAVVRGGTGGSNATALGYLQQLAKRARPGDANFAGYPSLTLPYILDERGRELFWECQRRTDLIRYGLFTTNLYLWDWKGGVRSGTAVDAKYNLYPIPAIDLSSNPNLKQNPGY